MLTRHRARIQAPQAVARAASIPGASPELSGSARKTEGIGWNTWVSATETRTLCEHRFNRFGALHCSSRAVATEAL